MELKPGYKKTQAGVIPEEWGIRPLLTTVQIASGQVDPRLSDHGTMVLVAPDHVESETGRLLEKRTAAEQHAISGKYLFKPGDIVYSKIRPYLRKAILADFQGLCSADMYPLTPVRDVAPAFMLAVLLGQRFSLFAESVSVRSGIPKINREELAGFIVALPPLPEQQAIAAALVDVDALIAKLDKLIAKKRALKQGAMQDLLTGKRRLPGFSGEWEEKRLGELAEMLKGSGLSKKALSVSGSRKCILYGELFTVYDRVISKVVSSTDSMEGRPGHYGDILMPGSTTTVGADLAIASALLEEEISLGGDINIIRKRKPDNFNSAFLAQYLTQVKKAEIAERAQGITIIHLYGRDLLSLVIKLPSLSEQTAISEVLSGMDAEIAALEARRAKTNALKQGMMQELLTGKTRLV